MKTLCMVLMFFVLSVQVMIAQNRYWISPASVRYDFWDMFKPEAKWDTLLSQIGVFSIHVNALSGDRLDTNLVKAAISKLNNTGVLINFECGGLRPFSGCDSFAGERHAQFELSSLSKWFSRGGHVDLISMDSPINTMIRGGDPSGTCNWTVEKAANEIVDYMKEVKKTIPYVRFALVEPVPWYSVGNYPNQPGNNYGNLTKILDSVFTIVESRGEKIDIFHSDSPYEYSDNLQTQGWLKLKSVEDWLHSKGIKHGRINNSQQGGFESNQLFYERTIDSYKKYKAVGGNPDEIEVWSWYEHPDLNYPESEPYTFTYTCKKLFELIGLTETKLTILEPEDGKVYHGVQTMTYESGTDPLAGYLGALDDPTIQPTVRGLFMGIPGVRGPDKALLGLKDFFQSADSIGFVPELSLFLESTIATDSIIAVSNQYDWIIDSVITLSKNYGKRMFLRIGGEFNGAGPGWNGGGYHPYFYVTMFRKISDKFAAKGLKDSIANIWCYEPDAANDFDSVDARGARWYPGDNYVNWFGLDVFDVEHFDQSISDYSRGTITRKGKSERFLAMARAKGKPVYLSETSAKGVNISSDNNDGINDWNNWFKKFWEFIDVHKEIKGFGYINANWPSEAYPNWGDARIQNSQYVSEKYKEEMRKPKYIHLRSTATTSVETIGNWLFPNTILLYQNYPNPFNPSTTITYVLPQQSHVTLAVFNTLGQQVAALQNGEQEAGYHEAQFDGSGLSSGVYFYRIQAGDYVQTKRLLLLR